MSALRFVSDWEETYHLRAHAMSYRYQHVAMSDHATRQCQSTLLEFYHCKPPVVVRPDLLIVREVSLRDR